MSLLSIAKPLSNITKAPLRLAIQGASGVGKTTAAGTFPNPVFVDFDEKLGMFAGREDIAAISINDKDYLETTLIKGAKLTGCSSMVGGLLASPLVFHAWLKQQGASLPKDVTLIIDSWTMMQNMIDAILDATPKQGKDGTQDGFDFWKRKGKFSVEILNFIKQLPCAVVVIFHESRVLDSTGAPTGKWNPLMSGSIKDSLGQHFTHWFRQTAEQDDKKETKYYWQVTPDNNCNCSCPDTWIKDRAVKGKIIADYKNLLP